MRLEIADTPVSPQHLASRYKEARQRLMGAPVRPVEPIEAEPVKPVAIPRPHTGTFGLMPFNTVQNCNVVFAERRLTVVTIIEFVCRHYSVSRMDVVSERRTAGIVRPRQVIMYLAKEMTTSSFPKIGRMLGGRDHTTALWGFRKIGALIQDDPEFAAEIALIRSQLEATYL